MNRFVMSTLTVALVAGNIPAENAIWINDVYAEEAASTEAPFPTESPAPTQLTAILHRPLF